MGWEQQQLKIIGRVSRHNSEDDDRDDALWRHLVRRVRHIAQEDQYKPLGLDVIGGEEN